jgi:dihydroxyacetone kinase-like protein
MNKGFSRCKELIEDRDINLTESLNTLGTVLLDDIGGSMGPLYGSFFLDMAAICRDKSEIDRYIFGEMLRAGLESIQSLGNAKLGDKTLLDTLIPAYNVYGAAQSRKASFKVCLADMVLAAEKGKESTRDLVAKVGRASRLGERSRGVLDAGAVSCFLILQAFANSIDTLIS